jgi:hypothetical protein
MITLKKPIVGVLVNHSLIRKLGKQNSKFKSYPRIVELTKASHETDVTLYFFSIKNFDFKHKRVLGTFYDTKSAQWRQKELTLPNILYNRGDEPSKYMDEAIETIFEQHEVLKINSKSYFDKWEVYQNLSSVAEVKEYLPYTKKYEQEADLAAFLKTHDEAYLKGVRGGRGRWIFRIRKLPEGRYEYSYFRDDLFVGQSAHWDDLIREVQKFYGDNAFVIQRAIDLIHIEDSKVDFRAEVQRNGNGELQILGVCARMGRSKSPITIHSSAYPLEVFLKDFLYLSEDGIQQMAKRIHEFLYSIYTALEKVYGTFGEIGIDFGLDQAGRLWFIEPNAKSAKVSLMKAYDEQIFHQAFVNPLNFAKYLFQRQKHKSEENKQKEEKDGPV